MLTGQQLKQKFDEEWGIVSRLSAAHPKTALAVFFAIGIIADHFLVSMIWK